MKLTIACLFGAAMAFFPNMALAKEPPQTTIRFETSALLHFACNLDSEGQTFPIAIKFEDPDLKSGGARLVISDFQRKFIEERTLSFALSDRFVTKSRGNHWFIWTIDNLEDNQARINMQIELYNWSSSTEKYMIKFRNFGDELSGYAVSDYVGECLMSSGSAAFKKGLDDWIR